MHLRTDTFPLGWKMQLPTFLYQILASQCHVFTALFSPCCLAVLLWSTVYKLLETLITRILTHGRVCFSSMAVLASSKTASFLWEAHMPADSPRVYPLASISFCFLLHCCLESLFVNCRADPYGSLPTQDVLWFYELFPFVVKPTLSNSSIFPLIMWGSSVTL